VQTCLLGLDAKDLELDPNAFTPVATTLVLTPPILIGFSVGPPPIVVINLDTKFRSVLVLLFDVPAVAILIAKATVNKRTRAKLQGFPSNATLHKS